MRHWEDRMDRMERERQNALLRQHGYRWVKEEIGSEDDWAGRGSLMGGTGEVVGYRWVLQAPDYSEVSVTHALEQIRTGHVPTRAALEARWAEQRKRAADLAGAGYFRSEDDLIPAFEAVYGPLAHYSGRAHSYEDMRAEDAAQGHRWHAHHLRQWLSDHDKRLLRTAGDLDEQSESRLAHPRDLAAMVESARQHESSEAAHYAAWQQACVAQEAERAAHPDALVLPSVQAALDALFSDGANRT